MFFFEIKHQLNARIFFQYQDNHIKKIKINYKI
jgi:hypothetical protein